MKFLASTFIFFFFVSRAPLATSSHGYQLSAGVEFGLPQKWVRTFDCASHDFGFYADVDNGCELYHVCMPIFDEEDQYVETQHYSFACGTKTVFSQQDLICTHPDEASPCNDAESLYVSSNLESGKFNVKQELLEDVIDPLIVA